eukprot:CAMPEP_0184532912 /NCGR_PEP_ID=MMETSP0198_2-20121128/14439_1 /TAXON_ID=1112570 /ORGANISM="Thraustochytrium sp., Strain LLF1b" /LENGTH=52 /DNA_ID=CAMNT_0026925579 /DNA_START=44 /DNA_END=199 /DNA_ORIENTATION=-
MALNDMNTPRNIITAANPESVPLFVLLSFSLERDTAELSPLGTIKGMDAFTR